MYKSNRNSSRNGRFNKRRNYGRRRNNFSRKKSTGVPRSRYISDAVDKKEENNTYAGKKFTELNLHPSILSNLSKAGFSETTEIQAKSIPLIVSGKDLLGISATGSGKTAAFLIPMINKILKNSDERLIIVAPTRELASQIAKEAISFAKGSGIYVTTIVGGESMGRQISSLKKDNRLIVGTPGRITDLIKRKVLKTKDINNIVVDEVDRMLDMGFIRDIQSLFKVISTDKQSLFFSATHNSGVDRTVKQLIRNYETIKLSNNTANNSVAQSVIDYSSTQEKMQLLEELLQREEVKKAIIFVETKRYADRVKKSLFSNKHRVDVIHGDKRQNYRNRVISKFRDSRINYLVATNVAARGIDIDDITHVINLDEPQNYDEYIHRIGRTGRNGSTGVAYTFLQK